MGHTKKYLKKKDKVEVFHFLFLVRNLMTNLPKEKDETEPDKMKHLLAIDYKIIPKMTV